MRHVQPARLGLLSPRCRRCRRHDRGRPRLRRHARRTPEQIRAEGLVYEGDTLNALITGNGLEALFLTEGQTPFMRISAARGPFDGMQSAGAFYALSPDELEALQGHRVRLTFRVRPPTTGLPKASASTSSCPASARTAGSAFR